MLNCREVSQLVSESLDHKISWWSRMNLWMHLSMCRFCSRFRKDVLHLHDETRRLAQDPGLNGLDSDVKLAPESRERITRALASQQ
jgi:hypothetical protein